MSGAEKAASVPAIHHHYMGNPRWGCPGAGSACDRPCPEWGVIPCSGKCRPPSAESAPYSPGVDR